MSAPPPEKGDSASGAAVDQSSPARQDFESHDWESDAQWQRYLQGVELPALPTLEAAALRRLKRKYWLRSVDPSATFPSDSNDQPAAPPAAQGSTPPAAAASSSSSASSGTNREGTSGPTSSGSAGSASGRQGASGQWPRGLGLVGAADVAANAAVVLSALALLLAGVSAAYRWLLLAVCATCALHLYRTLGSPQFSREYLARLMATDSTHYLLLALVFLNETPVLLLVPVVAIYALINTATYASALVSDASGLGHYVRLGTSYVLAKREQLYFAAAYLEILLLPLMVIKFFQGYVGLMGVVLYFQFVSARYRSNSRARGVATSLLGQLDTVVYTYLPSPVGALYHRLRPG
ncbi:Transmembrane protein 33 family protein, putative [Acanthamoeba castellanii str. Neff]|uniref:Transmembrane protein 33 family protein, putative n=1 Tax=Acanthamoeba castellanii (strain ATCC 30010 / Neff) TaxID=1257118 RepID=L8HG91_ACACF|nr:Transmembrane protein 33 family protein, putative [Acanthamoeba castellanii str. Neff]ELR23461.1 Transmembrane protein 33 family protein, putative [Acanthamoeba castellanii str. Neff]